MSDKHDVVEISFIKTANKVCGYLSEYRSDSVVLSMAFRNGEYHISFEYTLDNIHEIYSYTSNDVIYRNPRTIDTEIIFPNIQ